GPGGQRRRLRRGRRAHPCVHPGLLISYFLTRFFMTQALQTTIDTAWEQRASLNPKAAPADVRDAVNHIIDQLDTGKLRVAEKIDGNWVTHQWIKKAVLLSFRLNDNIPMGQG